MPSELQALHPLCPILLLVGVIWVSKSALLLAILGTQAVGCRALGVTLAGSYQVNQILLKILNLCIRDIADVRIHSGWWGIVNIIPIRLHCWVGGADSLVNVVDELSPFPAVWFCCWMSGASLNHATPCT